MGNSQNYGPLLIMEYTPALKIKEYQNETQKLGTTLMDTGLGFWGLGFLGFDLRGNHLP